jgi:hypothetical protein
MTSSKNRRSTPAGVMTMTTVITPARGYVLLGFHRGLTVQDDPARGVIPVSGATNGVNELLGVVNITLTCRGNADNVCARALTGVDTVGLLLCNSCRAVVRSRNDLLRVSELGG